MKNGICIAIILSFIFHIGCNKSVYPNKYCFFHKSDSIYPIHPWPPKDVIAGIQATYFAEEGLKMWPCLIPFSDDFVYIERNFHNNYDAIRLVNLKQCTSQILFKTNLFELNSITVNKNCDVVFTNNIGNLKKITLKDITPINISNNNTFCINPKWNSEGDKFVCQDKLNQLQVWDHFYIRNMDGLVIDSMFNCIFDRGDFGSNGIIATQLSKGTYPNILNCLGLVNIKNKSIELLNDYEQSPFDLFCIRFSPNQNRLYYSTNQGFSSINLFTKERKLLIATPDSNGFSKNGIYKNFSISKNENWFLAEKEIIENRNNKQTIRNIIVKISLTDYSEQLFTD